MSRVEREPIVKESRKPAAGRKEVVVFVKVRIKRSKLLLLLAKSGKLNTCTITTIVW